MSSKTKGKVWIAFKRLLIEIYNGNPTSILIGIILAYFGWVYFLQPWVIGNNEVATVNAMNIYELEQKLKSLEDKLNSQVDSMPTGKRIKIKI